VEHGIVNVAVSDVREIAQRGSGAGTVQYTAQWSFALVTAGGWSVVDTAKGEPGWVPLPELARVLDRLSADGWTVHELTRREHPATATGGGVVTETWRIRVSRERERA
jgi:hypothetical protein